jgi:hypothetical protein
VQTPLPAYGGRLQCFRLYFELTSIVGGCTGCDIAPPERLAPTASLLKVGGILRNIGQKLWLSLETSNPELEIHLSKKNNF